MKIASVSPQTPVLLKENSSGTLVLLGVGGLVAEEAVFFFFVSLGCAAAVSSQTHVCYFWRNKLARRFSCEALLRFSVNENP